MNISELLNNTARNDSHSNSTRCGVICHPVTPTEWVATQLPTITFGSVMTGTQLFNLLIFAFWRNKEPYITLHVALAVTSLFAGLSVLCTVPLRYQPLDVSIPLERFFGVALVLYMNCAGLLANLLISVDRWLSVEFPIKYRALVTHRKTRMAAIIGSFVVSLAVVGPGLVAYWDRIIVDPCSRRKLFLPDGTDSGIGNKCRQMSSIVKVGRKCRRYVWCGSLSWQAWQLSDSPWWQISLQ
ncbi:hypothetical protein BV898_12170 [Hypsibius exemplaris]|uniref:Uncharacterized protein n=1 Tax=Hypsibius exemplaris TaxID=2072580 RepID=A0A1W0WEL7_HYPEX|nr:hypothetical protein BV898_12170 [Hypsibius exemplaris]